MNLQDPPQDAAHSVSPFSSFINERSRRPLHQAMAHSPQGFLLGYVHVVLPVRWHGDEQFCKRGAVQ